jgi:hypothetical protein
MSKIKCMVEECKYNSSYLCDAKEIMVCSSGSANVKCADQTACHTFETK